MSWRRLDVPGQEQAHVKQTAAGWRFTGEVVVEETGVVARLQYAIHCDQKWITRSATIEGEIGGDPIRWTLAADGAGHWRRDSKPLPELNGALDVDLGFTPATNTLPIRRLDLAIGQSASVSSAWLRFPDIRLELLEQIHTREAERSFRYQAVIDGELFVACLEVDGYGRVLRYSDLWEVEFMEPANEPAQGELAF